MGAKASSRRLQVARGYRRLLVPLDARTESVEALEIACRLAADGGATITAVAVMEAHHCSPSTHIWWTPKTPHADCSSVRERPETRMG